MLGKGLESLIPPIGDNKPVDAVPHIPDTPGVQGQFPAAPITPQSEQSVPSVLPTESAEPLPFVMSERQDQPAFSHSEEGYRKTESASLRIQSASSGFCSRLW